MRGHQGAPKGPSLFSHRTRPCRVGLPTVSVTSHSRALARVQVGTPPCADVMQVFLRTGWGRRASALGLRPALWGSGQRWGSGRLPSVFLGLLQVFSHKFHLLLREHRAPGEPCRSKQWHRRGRGPGLQTPCGGVEPQEGGAPRPLPTAYFLHSLPGWEGVIGIGKMLL